MKSQPQHEDEDMDEERNDYVVLEALIQSNIESLQKLTMGNKSALHLAIECGASTSIIRLLIQSKIFLNILRLLWYSNYNDSFSNY
jgi:hypothetical protein